MAQMVKRLSTMRETQVWSLGWEDSLEKEMATPSSILAWEIPWTEEPGRLQSMGSQRTGHDWVSNTLTFSLSQWNLTKYPTTENWVSDQATVQQNALEPLNVLKEYFLPWKVISHRFIEKLRYETVQAVVMFSLKLDIQSLLLLDAEEKTRDTLKS